MKDLSGYYTNNIMKYIKNIVTADKQYRKRFE